MGGASVVQTFDLYENNLVQNTVKCRVSAVGRAAGGRGADLSRITCIFSISMNISFVDQLPFAPYRLTFSNLHDTPPHTTP